MSPWRWRWARRASTMPTGAGTPSSAWATAPPLPMPCTRRARRRARRRCSRRPRRSRRNGSPNTRGSIRSRAIAIAICCSPRAAPPRCASGRAYAIKVAEAEAIGCSTSPWITSPSAGRRWRWASLARPGRSSTRRSTACARRARSISLPRGLLARAALFRETGDALAARRDLDEAMRIARRGEMRLFQCDAHLESARLALAQRDRENARKDLAAASDLVQATGYGRRKPEVAELEARLRQA